MGCDMAVESDCYGRSVALHGRGIICMCGCAIYALWYSGLLVQKCAGRTCLEEGAGCVPGGGVGVGIAAPVGGIYSLKISICYFLPPKFGH
jgi:hypothetical protein